MKIQSILVVVASLALAVVGCSSESVEPEATGAEHSLGKQLNGKYNSCSPMRSRSRVRRLESRLSGDELAAQA